MRRGVWLPATAAVVLAVTVALPGCEDLAPAPEPVRPVRVMRIGEPVEVVGRKFPGRAEATQQVDLSFRVAGTLRSIPVRVGDAVAAGQVVAELDPRDFEIAVRDADALVKQREAELALAEYEAVTVRRLFENKAATQLELNVKQAAREAAEALLVSARARRSTAADTLSDTTLKAPFDGMVTATYAENFEDVQAKEPVLRILDDARIEMRIDVPENMIAQAPRARAGRILCEFGAFPGVLIEAQLKELGTEADAVTRTYPVRLIMDQPEGARILPGMTGSAWTVRAPEPADAERGYALPLSAVAENSDGTKHLWVVDEAAGVVRRREVTSGDPALAGLLVRGVAPGEVVVTAGVSMLSDGQRVRVDAPGAAEARP